MYSHGEHHQRIDHRHMCASVHAISCEDSRFEKKEKEISKEAEKENKIIKKSTNTMKQKSWFAVSINHEHEPPHSFCK